MSLFSSSLFCTVIVFRHLHLCNIMHIQLNWIYLFIFTHKFCFFFFSVFISTRCWCFFFDTSFTNQNLNLEKQKEILNSVLLSFSLHTYSLFSLIVCLFYLLVFCSFPLLYVEFLWIYPSYYLFQWPIIHSSRFYRWNSRRRRWENEQM